LILAGVLLSVGPGIAASMLSVAGFGKLAALHARPTRSVRSIRSMPTDQGVIATVAVGEIALAAAVLLRVEEFWALVATSVAGTLFCVRSARPLPVNAQSCGCFGGGRLEAQTRVRHRMRAMWVALGGISGLCTHAFLTDLPSCAQAVVVAASFAAGSGVVICSGVRTNCGRTLIRPRTERYRRLVKHPVFKMMTQEAEPVSVSHWRVECVDYFRVQMPDHVLVFRVRRASDGSTLVSGKVN